MSNFNGEAEKFYYSLKLDKLNENELYYLSNSLNIPKSDNKKDIIEKILNRLEYLQKDEFNKITKIIDNLLNKQEIKKMMIIIMILIILIMIKIKFIILIILRRIKQLLIPKSHFFLKFPNLMNNKVQAISLTLIQFTNMIHSPTVIPNLRQQ